VGRIAAARSADRAAALSADATPRTGDGASLRHSRILERSKRKIF
jgi:hypothetical protein